MKVYYKKQSTTKNFTRTFEESVKMQKENPEIAEMEIKSIDIPKHLADKFRREFEFKGLPQEKEVMDFLEKNK
jgi:hypothetical protein